MEAHEDSYLPALVMFCKLVGSVTPDVGTPGRYVVVCRPGAPVVWSPWIPGLPAELVWFCRPGKPSVGAVPEEDKGTKLFTAEFNIFQIFGC